VTGRSHKLWAWRVVHCAHWFNLLWALIAGAGGIEIVGPDTTPAYRRAAYSAKAPPSHSTAWAISPRGIADLQSVGDEVLIWAPPGRYELELLAVGPSSDAARPFVLERVYRKIDILPPPGPVPPPPPLPTPPGPTPTPPGPPAPAPIPAGRFGLARNSFEWLALLSPDARRTAPAIAANFRNVAQSVKNRNEEGLTIPRTKILAETLTANNDTLAKARTDWRPWFAALEKALVGLDLKSNDDIVEAWAEITTGLEAPNGSKFE
jgi:hypothetical protein